MSEIDYDRLSKVEIEFGTEPQRPTSLNGYNSGPVPRIWVFKASEWGPHAAMLAYPNQEKEARIAIADGRYLVGANGPRNRRYADERQRRRLRAMVLGTAQAVPDLFDMAEAEEQPLVPGLWMHGEIPSFTAPKGFVKTWLMAQLAAALVLPPEAPSARWLGFFDPPRLSDEDRARNVVLLNPETRPAAIEDVLLRCGLVRDGNRPVYRHPDAEAGSGALIVEHLVKSPTMFDLSDQAKADGVAELLIARDTRPPLVVIADGITAMLGNDTSRTGAFASEFMRLLALTGIPNGLGVLHQPMSPGALNPMGGLESMGQWHGQWIGEARSFPVEPTTPRWFHTIPRLGGAVVPRRRLLLGDDGLWRLAAIEDGEAHVSGSSDAGDQRAKEAAILEKLDQAGAPLWTNEVCPKGVEYGAWKAALKALELRGEVASEWVQEGRTRGYRWSLPGGDSDGS